MTLEEVAVELERAYTEVRARLANEINRTYNGLGERPRPEQMRDTSGRYILLDALVELSKVRRAVEER